MNKRLQSIGNSSGIIIDQPILELLKITAETELEISTDGERLIITPVHNADKRAQRMGRAQARTMEGHASTFRKLAE